MANDNLVRRVPMPAAALRIVAVTLINATIAVRLVNLVSRCLFSPLAAALRPLPMSDEQAAYLFIWTGRLAAIGVYGFFAVDLLSAFGLPDSSAALLIRLVGFAVAAMLMIVILQSRDVVAIMQVAEESALTAGALIRPTLISR